jgi:hypothetical protein
VLKSNTPAMQKRGAHTRATSVHTARAAAALLAQASGAWRRRNVALPPSSCAHTPPVLCCAVCVCVSVCAPAQAPSGDYAMCSRGAAAAGRRPPAPPAAPAHGSTVASCRVWSKVVCWAGLCGRTALPPSPWVHASAAMAAARCRCSGCWCLVCAAHRRWYQASPLGPTRACVRRCVACCCRRCKAPSGRG